MGLDVEHAITMSLEISEMQSRTQANDSRFRTRAGDTVKKNSHALGHPSVFFRQMSEAMHNAQIPG
jgi:hypothetical protein